MKILLDATTLQTPKSGIGHYTQKISSSLIKSEDFDPFFYFDSFFSKDLSFKSKKKMNYFQKIIFKNQTIKYKYSSLKIKNFIKTNNIKIFHQPNFIGYETDIKNIITVHDTSWIKYPQFFKKTELDFFDKYFYKSLFNSSNVIVHSNFVKNEIFKYFNYPEENIKVIYEDLRSDFQVLNEIQCNFFLKKYNLKYKKFFLVVNSLEERKNFDFIINTYQKLDNKIKKNFPLVIAGMPGRNADKILNIINRHNNCYYLGYMDEIYLNQCYSSAKVFFYPSVYEGFGISPLESMASGTPVLCSDINSSKEILDNAALRMELIEEKWVDNISTIIEDDVYYDLFVNRGLEKIKSYKPGNTVTAILKLYKNLHI